MSQEESVPRMVSEAGKVRSRHDQASDILQRCALPGSLSLDTLCEITRLASVTLGFPIAFLAFYEKENICLKCGIGVDEVDIPRAKWPCFDKLTSEPSLVVSDIACCTEGRNCFVTRLTHLQSLAAARLKSPDGHVIGALCLADRRPRRPKPSQLSSLRGFAELVERELTRASTAPVAKRTAPISVRPAEPGVDRLIYVTRATQSASDAILVTDATSGSRYANRAFVDLLGYTADEVTQLGGLINLYVDPSVSAGGLKEVAEGGHWAREVQLRAKSGAILDVSVRLDPICDDYGNVIGRVSVVTDIAERRRAEMALLESEARLRSLVQSIDDIVFEFDWDGRILNVWTDDESLLKYPKSALPGRLIGDLLPEFAEPYVKVFKKVIATGRPEHFEYELEVMSGPRSFLGRVTPIFSGDGTCHSVCMLARDITSRKEAEKELREAERKYRSIFENAVEGIFQTTPDGRLISVNPALARIHGFESPEQMITEVNDVATQLYADPNRRKEKIKTIQRQGFVTNFESEGRRRDGSTVWLSESVRQVCDANGNLLYYEGTVQDITERRRIRIELREQREFLRNVIDTDPNLIFVKDREGRFVMVNRATAEVYGTTVEGLIGKADTDFNSNAEEVAQFRQDDHRVMETGQELVIPEEKVTDAQGNIHWLQTVKRPLAGPNGNADQVLGIATDITARKQAEDALKEKEERFRLMIENASDVITLLDADGTVRYGSPSVERVLGYTPDEIVGKKIFDIIHPEDLAGAKNALLEGLSSVGKPVTLDIRLRHKDGSWRFVESIGSNQIDTRGVEGIVLNSRDITERRLAEQELDFLAYHDILTELPNRLLFMEQLNWAIEESSQAGTMAAVLFLDLDRFKIINDTLGHSLGDELLRAVAARLRTTLRENDIVSRWGGDEFTLMLPGIADTQEAVRAAQRIIATLSAPFDLQESEYYVTATVGISIYPSCGEDAETLIRNADTAMYRAKELGKNYYQLYMPSMNVGAPQKLALEQSLRKAIEREEFTLHFQPQIDAEATEIVGVESLLRWQHPDLGLVPPGDFIPLAEETGLIVPLGEWVLRTACRQAVEWEQAGYAPLRIAVNLSAHQFRRSDLIPTIAGILRETGLDPGRLELELTESVLIESEQQNIETLAELSAMGIRLAIDDFGTGYSSFIYLKRYPIDAIKIDRAFIRDVTVDPNDAAITQSLIAMAQNLKMAVIAEGVETKEQAAFLREHGCHLMQGYYFSAPLPADALASFLEKRSVHILKAA